VKGKKIELFQGLYERYSNLSLTYDKDRPVAIKGLEKRLIRSLKTTGGYGVFDCYLHRFLLWQRSGEALKPIKFSCGERIPSWSWMAHTGGIEYMSIPFGEVLWAENIRVTFKVPGFDGSNEDEQIQKPLELSAQARELTGYRINGVVPDIVPPSLDRQMKCVVLGTAKTLSPGGYQKYYALIASAVLYDGAVLYERTGVGVLDHDQIAWDVPAVAILII
jgi:hypothetical protein